MHKRFVDKWIRNLVWWSAIHGAEEAEARMNRLESVDQQHIYDEALRRKDAARARLEDATVEPPVGDGDHPV